MSKFGIVYREILEDPDLSVQAKGLYALLSCYADKQGRCFPKITTLAENTGLSRRTVQRLINELIEKEYVRRYKREFILTQICKTGR